MPANVVFPRLLTSRLHPLVSWHVLMLEVRGRRSGRLYRVPLSYRRTGGVLQSMTYRRHKWWRNLRGVDVVDVWLRGRRVAMRPEVIEHDIDAIVQALGRRQWILKAAVREQAEKSVVIRLHRIE